MQLQTRIEQLVKGNKSLPHIRDIELEKLVRGEPELTEAVLRSSYRVLSVHQNENATMSILEDMMSNILNILWEKDKLVVKTEVLKSIKDVVPTQPVQARVSMANDLAIKDRQLKTALETIKTLRGELTRLTRASSAREASAAETAETEPADAAPVDVPTPSAEAEVRTETRQFWAVGTETDPVDMSEIERLCLEIELLRGHLHGSETVMETLTSELAHERELTALTEEKDVLGDTMRSIAESAALSTSTRVNLIRKRSSMALESIFPTVEPIAKVEPEMPLPHTFDSSNPSIETRTLSFIEEGTSPRLISHRSAESSHPKSVSSSSARLEHLRIEELELMRQREVEDDLRIKALLREVVEKDELISVLSSRVTELSTVLASPKPESPRRASTVDTQSIVHYERLTLSAPLNSSDQGGPLPSLPEPSHQVSIILEEQLEQIAALQSQNDKLNQILTVFEEERESLTQRVEFLEKNPLIVAKTPRPGFSVTKEVPRMTDEEEGEAVMPCDFSLSRSDYVVIIPPAEVVASARLQVMYEAERSRANQAMEETHKARVCLSELERQLEAMKMQLRNSGVKHKDIEEAMEKAGLASLLVSARIGVFERLYQDALDRMARMERIREQVKQIQRKEYLKRVVAPQNVVSNLFEFRWDLRAVKSADNTPKHPRQGDVITRTHRLHRPEPRASSLSTDKILITTPLLPSMPHPRRIL